MVGDLYGAEHFRVHFLQALKRFWVDVSMRLRAWMAHDILTALSLHQRFSKREVADEIPEHIRQVVGQVDGLVLLHESVEVGHHLFHVRVVDWLLRHCSLRREGRRHAVPESSVQNTIVDGADGRGAEDEGGEGVLERAVLGEVVSGPRLRERDSVNCVVCLEAGEGEFVRSDSHDWPWRVEWSAAYVGRGQDHYRIWRGVLPSRC